MGRPLTPDLRTLWNRGPSGRPPWRQVQPHLAPASFPVWPAARRIAADHWRGWRELQVKAGPRGMMMTPAGVFAGRAGREGPGTLRARTARSHSRKHLFPPKGLALNGNVRKWLRSKTVLRPQLPDLWRSWKRLPRQPICLQLALVIDWRDSAIQEIAPWVPWMGEHREPPVPPLIPKILQAGCAVPDAVFQMVFGETGRKAQTRKT